MKKYQEYKEFSFPAIEAEVLKFWEEQQIFAKSISTREGQPTFTFYEGPPSANGMPGIHHVIARSIKDIFCRYKTLQGFQVKRKAGWDTHGLPVELKVEKELGITKDDIGRGISIEEYNQKCREAVMRFTDVWEDLTRKMGYWVDMDDPYVTYHNNYIESVWYLLKEIHKKGLLYKGYTVQPYSPKAGSGLSSHELNMPGTYKDVTDTSITGQFKVKQEEVSSFLFETEHEDVRILAWTTTPWTLPSNCALAIGEKIDYVKVRTFNQYTFEPISVVLAKDLVDKHFSAKNKDLVLADYQPGDKKIPFEVVQEFKGKQLVGIHYEQLMPYVTNENLEKNAFRVIPGDFVTTEDGTGVVHTASVFGADDFRVAQQNNVPAVMITNRHGQEVPLVNKRGQFEKVLVEAMNVDLQKIARKHGKEEHAYDLPKYMKQEYETEASAGDLSSDILISILLKEQNKAFKVEKYKHSYPHCWRTDKPVLYYPLDSWFIKTTAVKDRLVELNKQINWKPKTTGEGRFGNWLENLVDWNLSRQRYWGIPLPVWRNEEGTEELCIGSIAELQQKVKEAQFSGQLSDMEANENEAFLNNLEKDDFDLHRPYVDQITLVSDTGAKLTREKDLIDVWFDSGSMPYAQLHYPFENEELFKETYPADFISEGVDQTRGWFFTLHTIAGLVYDQISFKNVVSTGLVLDKNGQKMSKRLGNAVDPFKTLGKYGADATRWYMISNANPWDNLKFDEERLQDVSRRFFGTLKNTYAFFALYANLDHFTYAEAEVPFADRPESDRWIISKLNSLCTLVGEAYENYEPTQAARLIQDFTIDDLSNWYVRLNRKRFWKSDYNPDKIAAYQTLYTCLETLAKLASPIMPFYTERIYQDLNSVSGKNSSESVHLCDFPKADPNHIDKNLEEKMDLAQRISSLTHSIRKSDMIRVRQPLSKLLIPVLEEDTQAKIQEVSDLILSEVNVKKIDFVGDDSGILVKSIKPNFKVLGQKYKKQVKDIVKVINTLEKADISTLERTGSLQKGEFEIIPEDVLITSQQVEGYSVASESGLTVALDVELNEDLKKEGLARDFVNRVQNLRKDSQLEVQDKILIQIGTEDAYVQSALKTHEAYIAEETQALSMAFTPKIANGQVFEIEEYSFEVSIKVEK